jgi:hypothetical protein
MTTTASGEVLLIGTSPRAPYVPRNRLSTDLPKSSAAGWSSMLAWDLLHCQLQLLASLRMLPLNTPSVTNRTSWMATISGRISSLHWMDCQTRFFL